MTGCNVELADPVLRLKSVTVLSTFSPSSDGIARYADQLVAALARDGVPTRRIGLADRGSGGDATVDVTRGVRFLRVIRLVPRRETLLVMWHTHYLAPGRQLARIMAVASLAVGLRMRRTIVLQHEPDDDLVAGTRGVRRLARLVEERLRRLMWQGPAEIWFHTSYERDAFQRRYPAAAARTTLALVTHGESFSSEVTIDRGEARRMLGVPADEQMFLCLGYLSAHKQVDGVIRVFAGAAPTNARLWIVGGAMKLNDETRRHIDELHRLASQTDKVEISERYLDDEEFDVWLRAADYVVVAYRTAASSGVIPRAQMMGSRVIGSGVGGTAEQLRPHLDVLAPDEESLRHAFLEAHHRR